MVFKLRPTPTPDLNPKDYPAVFPELPEGLEYGDCSLRAGGWRG
jgi:hypothetical protein